MDLRNSFEGEAENMAAELSLPDILLREPHIARIDNLPRHWLRGDPEATAFLICLSAVFPTGEAFMMRSVAAFRSQLPHALRADCDKFVQQEAGHSHGHEILNEAIGRSGYDLVPLEAAIKGFVDFFAAADARTKLCATMCIEHFTAIIAAEMLRDPHHLDGCDRQVLDLFRWHSIEEIEHKAVAFDVWQHVTAHWHPVRRYLYQSAMMVAVSLSFFINRSRGQIELLHQDGMPRAKAITAILRHGFGRGGIGRNILRSWASFFKPGFHPWQIDDRALLKNTISQFSPGTSVDIDNPVNLAMDLKQVRAA